MSSSLNVSQNPLLIIYSSDRTSSNRILLKEISGFLK